MSGATCAIFIMTSQSPEANRKVLRLPGKAGGSRGGQPEPSGYRPDAGSRPGHYSNLSVVEFVQF